MIESILTELLSFRELGLFFLRLMVGTLFFYSGQRKIRDIKGFSKHNGLPVLIGFGAILFELLGGLMLILGIYSQIAALMIILIMLGAIYHHVVKWKSPYWAQNKGWEYDLMWLVMCLVILTSGGGSYSLESFL